MEERKGVITFMGNPLTLLGPSLKVGDKAPNFTVLDNALNPVQLSSYKGKVCILSSVPSLDTPVCDLETAGLTRRRGLWDRMSLFLQ